MLLIPCCVLQQGIFYTACNDKSAERSCHPDEGGICSTTVTLPGRSLVPRDDRRMEQYTTIQNSTTHADWP